MRRSPKNLPLRQRLILWYLGLLVVVLTVFSGAVYAFLRNSLDRSAQAALHTAAVNLAQLHQREALPRAPIIPPPGRDPVERLLTGGPLKKFVQVIDITGRQAPAWLEARRDYFPLTQRALENLAGGRLTYEVFYDLGPSPVLIVTMPVVKRGRLTDTVVQVGASLESVDEALQKLSVTLMLALPICLVIASLGGWILADKAMRPVDQVTRAVRRINAENLRERLAAPGTDDEIDRLVETFNEMLERLDHSFAQIRHFTADASHELRTPLTILKGEFELALRRPRTVDEYQDIIASGLEEIERLTRITTDLLLLAKADSESMQIERQPVNLSALMEDASVNLLPLAEEKQIALEVLPGLSDLIIEGDPFRLRQMVLNLVENAIHYTPTGGKVVVRVDKAGPFYAMLEVSDTGIGIPPEEHERIFERFYRTDKARSRREGGTGLGLAIVKWIADRHGGKIVVDSRPGRGSTFTVYLPYYPEAAKQAPPEREKGRERQVLLH